MATKAGLLPFLFFSCGQSKFYAVKAGRVPGIYETWEEVEPQVRGFKFAKHQSFCFYDEVVHYMRTGQVMRKKEAVPERGSEGGTSIADALRAWSLAEMGGSSARSPAETSFSNAGYSPGLEQAEEDSAFSDGNKSGAEWLLALVCRSLEVSDPFFICQEIERGNVAGHHGFTVILPKSSKGLEVVAYGPVSADEATARREAAIMMARNVLSATTARLRHLEQENYALKKHLALEKIPALNPEDLAGKEQPIVAAFNTFREHLLEHSSSNRAMLQSNARQVKALADAVSGQAKMMEMMWSEHCDMKKAMEEEKESTRKAIMYYLECSGSYSIPDKAPTIKEELLRAFGAKSKAAEVDTSSTRMAKRQHTSGLAKRRLEFDLVGDSEDVEADIGDPPPVLDAVATMLQDESHSSYWWLPTTFQEIALNPMGYYKESLDYIVGRYMGYVDETFKIFVPLRLDNHWYLMIVDFEDNRSLVYLDSLKDVTKKKERLDQMDFVAFFLQNLLKDRKFYRRESSVCNNDSGVWVAHWMQMANLWSSYNPELINDEHRYRLATSLVTSKANLKRDELGPKALRYYQGMDGATSIEMAMSSGSSSRNGDNVIPVASDSVEI
ncbi:hypothetical protein PIB30_016140 [Stylosanthes scabra]|uniref:Ubiquitin-like protease family profile domain-containing protein n=1 Tax=Stylosanthes scabra TaxID=79078 RepID=A0ABU6S7J9_9FABA|nr:hypothetical protein [Stylosanthes scabra]